MRTMTIAALGVVVACGRGGFDPISDAGPEPPAGRVISVAAGDRHTCAILEGGELRCWGNNSSAELGSGNLDNLGDDELPSSGAPVDVGGPVTQVALGLRHTCALLDTGRVRCWGSPAQGALGHANLDVIGDNETPATAGDLDLGGIATQLEAGQQMTCALLDSGAVRCWGVNNVGQLGHGDLRDIGDDETPAAAGVLALGGRATQIAVGTDHACALLDTGAVRCWGDGASGRLGYGNTDRIGDDEVPSTAGDVPLGAPAIQISAGEAHTCAVLDTHAVRCWGDGGDGRLGYGNTNTIGDLEPPSIAGDVPLGAGARQVVAGDHHTCALLETGDVRCWGSAAQGRLGYANTNDIGDTEAPTENVILGGAATQLTAGGGHTCALVRGHVRCWGEAAQGRLGYGGATLVVGDDDAPSTVPAVDLGITAEHVTAGTKHTCALLTGGGVACWGGNGTGAVGIPTQDLVGDDETPREAGPVALGGVATQIAAGAEHTCARMTGNSVRCWGNGALGRLGYANTINIGNNETPVTAGTIMLGGTAIAVASGGDHTCALLAAGTVRCWGNADHGQLGYGNTTPIGDTETPASAGNVSVGGTVTELALGDGFTCALLTAGTVRCWGAANIGQLGYGNTTPIGDTELPSTAGDVPVGGTVTQISAGNQHVCAVLTGGTVRCWGNGGDGRLGYGNTTSIGNNETPASVGDVDVGGPVSMVAAGAAHTCALRTDGHVRCWGRGTGGRLGYASTTPIGDNEPPAIAGDVDLGGLAIELAAGTDHTCALLADKRVRCWGNDRGIGLLGQGIAENIGDDETPAEAGDVPVE